MRLTRVLFLLAIALSFCPLANGQTGTFLEGAGWYNLATAKANSINVDAAIRWKSDLRKIQAEGRNRRAAQTAGFKGKAEEAIRQQRIRDEQIRANPAPEDIFNGDALDLLMYDLTDPNIKFESWRAKPVALPEKMSVKDIIYKFTPINSATLSLGNGVIALSRLEIKDKWPTSLKIPELANHRIAFESAYAKVKADSVAGTLMPDAVVQLGKTLDSLRSQATVSVPKENGFREAALRSVDELRKATQMFNASTVDYAREILVDTAEHDATTVAELMAFMQKYRLQFADASNHPETRELYAKLYAAMKEQADVLGINAQVEVSEAKPSGNSKEEWGAAAKVGAKWVGSGTSSSGYTQKQDWIILSRNGNKFVMREDNHRSGNKYDRECEFISETEFKILKTFSVKTKAELGERENGGGTIQGQKFTLNYLSSRNTVWNSSGMLSK